MLAIVCPLLLAALPETRSAVRSEDTGTGPAARKSAVLWLIIAAVALNSFVTFGFEAVGIELFRALGADMARAVGIASLMGVFKVAGRIVDLLGGRRWDSLTTARVSGAMIPLVFYRKADYAAAMSAIALPLNLTSALAPPALAALLTMAGTASVLGLLAALSGAAFLVLLRLQRLHRSRHLAGPA